MIDKTTIVSNMRFVSARDESLYRLARLLKKARRQMSNAVRLAVEPMDVSVPVVQVLKRLMSEDGLSQLGLAQELELEPGALSRLLTSLEEQRLLTRRRDPADKRRVLMTPTARGKALVQRAQPHLLSAVKATFSRLNRQEQAELTRLLEKVV